MRTAVSSSRRTLQAPREKLFHLLVRHGLPPVGIEDLNFAFQRAQSAFLAGGFFGADDIHHRYAAAADGYWLPVFDGLNQFRQLVLGVGYADLHGHRIAI